MCPIQPEDNLVIFYKSGNIQIIIMNAKRLDGKIAIVTGSTYGIGYAIAEKLAKEGATVIVSSRKQEHVDKAVRKLREKSYAVFGVVCHISNAEHRKNLFQEAEKLGGLDILVQNAAVNPAYGSGVFDCSEESWDKIFEVNVKSSFLLSQEALPLMKRSKAGRIIYIASQAAFCITNILGAYGVSKVALIGLAKYGSVHLAEYNITVNCVAPGLIETEFVRHFMKDPVIKLMLTQSIIFPLKRAGQPEEVSGIVAFLASDEASYITGETVVVGGGVPSRL